MSKSTHTRSAGGFSAGILLLSLLTLLGFSGCATMPEQGSSYLSTYGAPADAAWNAQESRTLARTGTSSARKEAPGLGTKWGEARDSEVRDVDFRRAGGSPTATTAIYYNDSEGSFPHGSRGRQPFPIGGGLATIGIKNKSGFGGYLPGSTSGGRNHVVGREGQRYAIEIKNRTGARIEVVLSVDGLDVIDGKGASYGKRGYLIATYDKLEVDGFRKSYREVAAFRFSGIEASYAARRHGDTRNVGVIGAAVFHERGSDPYARRGNANPFPGEGNEGRFASPPGR